MAKHWDFAIYSQMKRGEVCENQSKNTKPDKATLQEPFIALWKIKSQLENVSVRDENRKLYPVMHLFMMIEGYFSQVKDSIRPGLSLQEDIPWEASE